MLALRLLRNRCIDTVFLLSLNLTDYSLHLFFRCKFEFEFEFEFEFSIGLSTVLYLADVSQTRGNGSMYHVQHVISFLSYIESCKESNYDVPVHWLVIFHEFSE